MKPAQRWGWATMAAIAVVCGAGYLTYRHNHAPLPAGVSPPPLGDRPGERGRRALLVGCGSYIHPSIRPLEGPVNDVRLLKDVLVERCGFAPDQIVTLAGTPQAGDAPTRANIEREFRRLGEAARPGDQIVVLLAGHGSQQPNGDADFDDVEADGLDEIFLPIDAEPRSNAGGNDASGGVANAIIDDEIHRWTAEIAEHGASVWMIFDCCCAGTAIRGEYAEVPRFVSPVGDARLPESRSGSDEARWEALPSDRIVAFYACQAHESEVELALPPAKDDANVQRAKHGLFTYALCCALSEPANLTYRDLERDIWLRYRALGRASPTPFIDCASDRQVLGERRAGARYRVVRRSGDEGVIDAGALQGLTPGSIVALHSATAGAAEADDRPAGYARVTRVQPATARIVPCAYGETPRPSGLEVGAWCELAYADYGDMRLAVAIDHESATRTGQSSAALARLAERLRSLANAPAAVFRVVGGPSEADWVVQMRESAIQLLPASVAELAEGEPLPLGAPQFTIGATDSADAVAGLLHRVFRAQNLIKLAGGAGNARAPGSVKIKLELRSESLSLADAAVLVPGQEVEWKITNEGTAAVDLTLLFIDSQFAIEAAYPKLGEPGDNRLAPGKSLQCTGTVNGDTVGTEYLVAIAARARGPQRDFRCLAEPSLDAARNLAAAVRGGGPDVLQSPFGRLLRYALYHDESVPGATRGLASTDADDCRLALRAWVVKPK